jgi:glutathione peroxidase
MRQFLCLLLMTAAAMTARASCEDSILNHDERRLLGSSENLCQAYGGKVVLVVNTASKCGYTPQYEGLEALYKQYREQGLVVLGFPSDQFMHQEYDDEKKIADFCKLNYGVSFPMFGKTAVTGKHADPLFQQLAEKTGSSPGWNFNKYLVSREGKAIAHYGSDVKPGSEKLRKAIEAELRKP